MGMSAVDELKIFQNILAQSPQGLNDPNLIGKFAKAKFQMHTMDSMNEMQTQNMPPTGSPQPPQPTQTGQAGNSAPQEELGATGLENQANPMAGKYDAL